MDATRRQTLKMGAAAVAAAVVGCGDRRKRPAVEPPPGSPEPTAGSEPTATDEALDEALRLLHTREPKSRQGLSTHAPMVAEALCRMGFPERALVWVTEDDAPDLELPTASKRIDRERWREALGPRAGASTWEGALERWGDWKEHFVEELAEARWQDTLDTWTARLSPGLSAAATHGVIRTAHAASALSRRETPERRAELARGLAYWAAAYEELPAQAAAADHTRMGSYEQALALVPLFWGEHHSRPTGNIVSGLREAGALRRFPSVRDLVAAPTDVASALSLLSATFAQVYLRHGTRHDAIAFVHAVTGPCALRRIAPHVKPETALAALPYAWQAAAGIYAAYARKDDRGAPRAPTLPTTELAARAADARDPHAIKFTDVLLAEHTLDPDPTYLAAAEDALSRL